MSGKKLMIGWTILMVVLAVTGCGPSPVTADDAPAFGPAFARDAAMSTVWTEDEPLSTLDWTEEDLTPQDLVGSSTIRYTAGDWVVTVIYPIVAPDQTIYQVSIANAASGFAWNGEVDAQGNVSEADGGPEPLRLPVITSIAIFRLAE